MNPCVLNESVSTVLRYRSPLQRQRLIRVARLDKFREQIPDYKLEAIGATRWQSRSNPANKIFGRIDE